MPVDDAVTLETLPLPDGLPPWLAAFISEALRETDTLRENGADQAASARMALLKKLVAAAAAWFNAELDTATAAAEAGAPGMANPPPAPRSNPSGTRASPAGPVPGPPGASHQTS